MRITNEYTIDGVLKYAIAWYGHDKISTIELINPQNSEMPPPSISGLPTISVSIIGIISVVVVIVRKRKERDF